MDLIYLINKLFKTTGKSHDCNMLAQMKGEGRGDHGNQLVIVMYIERKTI